VRGVRSKRTSRAPSSPNRALKINSGDLVVCNWYLGTELRRYLRNHPGEDPPRGSKRKTQAPRHAVVVGPDVRQHVLDQEGSLCATLVNEVGPLTESILLIVSGVTYIFRS
jgi:hypothetical protein